MPLSMSLCYLPTLMLRLCAIDYFSFARAARRAQRQRCPPTQFSTTPPR